jgi:MFS family permease
VGAAFNHLGMVGEQVILSLLVFQITQSSAWVGATLALYSLPGLFFGVLFGIVADRLDRRTLLRGIELAITINLVIFSTVNAIGLIQIWAIMVFTGISGTLRAMYHPVCISYAYDIVGGQHIVRSLGLLNLGTRLGSLVGALIAGVLMERLGSGAAFFALALAHGMAFASVRGLRSAGLAAAVERVRIRQNLLEYMIELRDNRILLMLVVLTASVEVFGFSFYTALPELATTRFEVGAAGLGVLHAALAVGGIIAGLALSSAGGFQRRGAVYLIAIYAFGASLLLLAASAQFVLAMVALVLVAALAATSDILTQSLVQLSVPDHLRGRAMGAWILAVGASPLGHLQMGVLAVVLGVGGALAVNGAALIAIGVLATFVAPRLRRL